MSQVPKIVWARLRSQPIDAHPDTDVLTAFYEQALPENERGVVLAHLAQCSDCRDVVALAMPELVVERSHQPAGHNSALGWPTFIRWGSVVACMLVVGAAVMLNRPTPVAVRPTSESEVVIPEESHPKAASAGENPTSAETVAANQAASDNVKDKEKVSMQAARPASHAKETRPDETRTAANGKFESVPAPAPQFEARTASPSAAIQSGAMNKALRKKQSLDFAFAQPGAGGAIGGIVAKPVPSTPATASEPSPSEKEAGLTQAQASLEVPGAMKFADTPGRAKVGSANGVPASDPDQHRDEVILADSFNKAAQASPAGVPATLATTPALWTLSSDGQLQRSFDRGQSWHPAPLLEQAKFTAVSAIGLDIWVGGAAGLLYHSTNSGVQWTLIKPTASGVALTGDISDVHFTDPQHGTVTTVDKEQWTTADSGATWQKRP